MSKSLEDIYIRNIEASIRGIRLNTKTPADVGGTVANQLGKLKAINEGMHDDLVGKYKKVVEDYHKFNAKK